MVEGHEIDKGLRPLVVVDLDGTLVRGNTFHIYVKCGLRGLRSKGHLLSCLKVLMFLGLRKLRIISHRYLKFKVLPLFLPDDELKKNFVAEVKPLINIGVESLLDDLTKEGCTVLLATAAADTYIPWIWSGDYQATEMNDNPDRIENRGEFKLKNVLRFAETNHLYLHAVLTDHHDDIPLLSYGAMNILVNPKRETEEIVRNRNIKVDRIIR